jgi:hypothetical protein
MAYTQGSLIEAADYMGFRGPKSPSEAYLNDGEASSKLAALIGIGFGTRGYGQISTSIPSVSVGSSIEASQWNSIISVLATLNTHTGSVLTLPSLVSIGDIIQAYDGGGGRPNLPSLISSLDTNRNQSSLSQMTLSSKLSSARSTSWTVQVVHEFTVSFTDENSARYFFNSGGQTRLSASKTTSTVSPLNTAISQLLSNMGTIQLGASATTYTGTGGTPSAIGYYQLTGTYQTVFFQPGPGGYSSPSYTLRARTENILGDNGGNGNLLRMRAVFDTNSGAYTTVDGTLTSLVSELRATGAVSVSSPTYTTVTNL